MAVVVAPSLPAPERSLRVQAATINAIDAVNVAVGELAFTLEPDDPCRAALSSIQGGLDELWRITTTRRRIGLALDRIGHQSSPIFRNRLAGAFDEVSR